MNESITVCILSSSVHCSLLLLSLLPHSSFPEVTTLLEGILENTVLNIIRESDAGEFNITAPLYLVAQDPIAMSSSH